jgi:hypothetical protein
MLIQPQRTCFCVALNVEHLRFDGHRNSFFGRSDSDSAPVKKSKYLSMRQALCLISSPQQSLSSGSDRQISPIAQRCSRGM